MKASVLSRSVSKSLRRPIATRTGALIRYSIIGPTRMKYVKTGSTSTKRPAAIPS